MDRKGSKEKDRHSRTGIRGEVKKQGAGGKGTWGKAGIDDLQDNHPKKDDPNFNSSDEEEQVVMQKTEITTPVVAIVHDYLLSSDLGDVISGLKELNDPTIQEQFVKKALTIAMEHHSYERELISKLLSGLYGDVIPAEKFVAGFQACLDSVEDLSLDTPDAPEILGKFLARAIVDEIIAPAFLKTATAGSPKASEVLAMAAGLITESHRLDRLAHIWGPGDLSSVKRLKEEVNLLLQEYLSSGDTQEADRSLRRLNAPSFHFQLVKQLVRMALQLNTEEKKKLSKLLFFFYTTGLITSEHIERGFKACHAALPDIALDVPDANQQFTQFLQVCKEDKVPTEFTL